MAHQPQPPSPGEAPVVDWHEAMQQCGDDEDFLRELLGDLRAETEAQLAAIRATIQVRFESPPLPPILLLLLLAQCRRGTEFC
jgi:hypothetical protein